VTLAIPKAYVLMPAYNEAASLRELVPDIVKALRARGIAFTIVVVNDGSRDETAAVLQNFPPDYAVQTLSHEVNRGYGASLRTGYLWIVRQARPDEAALSLDADRTHSPAYFASMLDKLSEGFDVVTASYMTAGGRVFGVPLRRRIMSQGANVLFRCAARIDGTHAYTNGFRVYRISALQAAFGRYGDRLIEETGFAGGTELLLKVCAGGARTAEVPFDLHYENRGADSKIHIRRTIQGYLSVLRRMRDWKSG